MNTTLKSLLAVVAVVVIGLASGYAGALHSSPAQQSLGGKNHNIQESFDQGLAVNNVQVISSSGAWTGSTSTTNYFGTVLGGNFIQGYGLPVTTYTTSTVITATTLCSGGTLFVSTNAVSSTLTFPAATSTLATCGAGSGTLGQANFVYNSSTAATVTMVFGTGSIPKFLNTTTTAAFTSSTIPAGGIMRMDGQIIDASNFFFYETPYK